MSITNAQFAKGLRELADIYDSDERMIQPEVLDLFQHYCNPEKFRGAVMALALGGKIEKLPPRDDTDYFYKVRRTMAGGLIVELSTARSNVCRKVTKAVMTETWECPDSLLDPDAAAVQA